MITRSKLVVQLRDYQIRSQHKCPSLTIFSSKPHLSTWADVAVAIFWALVFIVFIVSSYVTLYLKHYWISFSYMPGHLSSSAFENFKAVTCKEEGRKIILAFVHVTITSIAAIASQWSDW